MESALNQLLLDLYALTKAEPSPQFGGVALEILKRRVPFDTAIWATFTSTPQGPQPHWHYLHGLPAEMLASYEQVKHYDIVNQLAVANCGRTMNVSLKDEQDRAHPAVVAHARRWGMEQTLATMHLETPLNLYTAVCLYRRDPDDPFSERERLDVETVVPHLVQAWHINAIHFLDAPLEGPRHGSAARGLVDRFGVLHNAEPGLSALFRQEVPDWQGPGIPAPLAGIVQNGQDEYKGTALIATLLRRLPDSTFVISVRSRAKIDSLSRRELAVARHFASGKTYKEIAGLLGTSPTTVRSQLRIVYDKLGIRSKVDLVKHVEHQL